MARHWKFAVCRNIVCAQNRRYKHGELYCHKCGDSLDQLDIIDPRGGAVRFYFDHSNVLTLFVALSAALGNFYYMFAEGELIVTFTFITLCTLGGIGWIHQGVSYFGPDHKDDPTGGGEALCFSFFSMCWLMIPLVLWLFRR